MNKKLVLALTAALSAAMVFGEGETAGEAVQSAPKKEAPKVFITLPFCRRAGGVAEVRKPGENAWSPIEEGRFYPLGSSYRTGADGSLELGFGGECVVTLRADSSLGTRLQPLGGVSRTITLEAGTIEVKLPDNMPEGTFFVTAPGFTVKNPAGEAKFVYTDKGDGFEATVRCVTGTMQVDGRHFAVPRMRAADEFRIRCDRDNLETLLYGTSGDYIVLIDRGIVKKTEIDDEGMARESVMAGHLEWHLSPETRVQINRAVPAVGEKLAVAVLTFDPAGNLKNHFAFTEGSSEVNTGELIKADKDDAAAIAKKAAEATTEESAADDEEEKTESKDEESSDGDAQE